MEAPLFAKTLILQMLLEGPSYGRELAERARIRTGGHVDLSDGSIYPALRTLRSRGLVAVSKGVRKRGAIGAPVRFYSLTDRGRALALAERAIGQRVFAPPPPNVPDQPLRG